MPSAPSWTGSNLSHRSRYSRRRDETVIDNLALACVFCNRYKGSDIASIVGQNQLVRLYHPRNDRWRNHFHLKGVIIEPLSQTAEATIRILQMNHDDQILERLTLKRRGRYPSEAARLLITEH